MARVAGEGRGAGRAQAIAVACAVAWVVAWVVAWAVSLEPMEARAQPRPTRCEPVSRRDAVLPGALIDTGQYVLTLVATTGRSQGASVRGNLWLRSTTEAHDSLVVAGVRRPVRDTARVPLYGALTVDLAGVSAPVPYGGAVVPDPRSFDPRRPGVIVTRRLDSAGGSLDWQLLIATRANDRRRCDSGGPCMDRAPDDGPGVVLAIHKHDGGGFAGSWRPVAGTETGGYFCAEPVRYYSPYRTKRVALPPPSH